MHDGVMLSGVIVKGWEKTENENGVPYFINHKSKRTSWDHPYFEKLLTELKEMDNVKFAAYRTAFKLRHLQKALKLNEISLHTVAMTFIRYGYRESMDAIINCEELKLLLVEMYSTVDKLSQREVQIHADLLQNFLLNAYDIKRRGRVKTLSVKVALGCLCNGRLSEKYNYFYRQLCDASFFISRTMLGTFLLDSLQVPECLHERRAFGSSNINPAVDTCIRLAGQGPGISKDSFLNWLLKEPQTLVWLPTLHRVASSEKVKHHAKCFACKACPIVGFRYRCLLCFRFDMCQQCFLSGKGHKMKHPIQEFCFPMSTKEGTKTLMKTVRNHLSKKHRKKTEPNYLPTEGIEFFGANDWTDPVKAPERIVLKEMPRKLSSVRTVQQSDVMSLKRQAEKLQNHRSQLQPKLVGNKENFFPSNWLSGADEKNLSISVENPGNLDNIIHELEAENRTDPVKAPERIVLKEMPRKLSSNHAVPQSDVLSLKRRVDKPQNHRLQLQPKLVGNKENFSQPNWLSRADENNLSVSVENPVNLESIIDELEAENRRLYQLLELNLANSDTESNASVINWELEEENVVLEAKLEALEDHNSTLSTELTRVRGVLQLHLDENESLHDDTAPSVYVPRPSVSSSSFVTATNDSSNFSYQTVLQDGSLVTIGDLCTPEAETQIGYNPQESTYGSPYLTNYSTGESAEAQPVPDSVLEPTFDWDSVDGIIDDTDLRTSDLTLPSITQSEYLSDPERQLDSMVEQLMNGFPTNLSDSGQYRSEDPVWTSAKRVGDAMFDYVNAISNCRQKHLPANSYKRL